jgi:GAF domain-containing protein
MRLALGGVMTKVSRTQKSNSALNPSADLRVRLTQLQQRVAALEALQESSHTLTSELVLDQLLGKILQSAVQVMQASAGSLLLHDPATDELVFSVVQGGGGAALKNTRISCRQGIAGSVFTSRQPSIVHDVRADARFLKGIDVKYGFHTVSMIAVPMLHKGEPTGVIEVMNKESGEQFNQDDQELLLAFAAQSAIAIQNARLYQQVVTERDRILAVEEEVRRELARDLHDGPSQLISAIIMEFRFLKEVIRRQPDKASEELRHLEDLATHALHQVRNMVFDLRPLILETQGLCAALEL